VVKNGMTDFPKSIGSVFEVTYYASPDLPRNSCKKALNMGRFY
jgi:hypothetical protein